MIRFIGPDKKLFWQRALEEGYFPENLPPVFQISKFYNASAVALSLGEYLVGSTSTEPSRYNASKRGGQRRTFSMPNPIFMVDAAIFFTKYDAAIDEHLIQDSLSYPAFISDEGRPLRIATYPEFHKKRREELATSRYIVRTDISRFFHSIYTHSIPWALHGKAAAKRDRKKESLDIYGNRLDYILRQSQDGQTIGIPVGPDFSRLSSEILASAIEKLFRKRGGEQAPVLRLVDDIYIGADTADDASNFLSIIQQCIKEFELDINEGKTAILNSADDIEPYWPVEIRREFEKHSIGQPCIRNSQDKIDFVHLLDEILHISKARSDDGIIKFALRKIDEFKIWVKYWELLEPFLIRCALNFPHSWDYVARVVAWRTRVNQVNKSLWQSVSDKAIAQNAVLGYDSEVSWALWLIKEIGGGISEDIFMKVVSRCGPFPTLLALDIYDSSNPAFNFPREAILDKLGEKPMLGDHWILAYEGERQFGLKIKTRNMQGHDLFRTLYDHDVSFYLREAVPVVFEDVEDVASIYQALEDPLGSYDDLYSEDEDEDDADDAIAF